MTSPNFMVIGLQIRKLHRGGGIRPPPPAVLDSKKPGLFRVKYDVNNAIVQDIEKIKVQYFKSLLFVLFEILKAVKVNKRISLHFKFCCYGQSNENN